MGRYAYGDTYDLSACLETSSHPESCGQKKYYFHYNKEELSKGEQQLYATALLKSLVEESGIDFPVVVDSPLQKFDDRHSINVITKFLKRNINGFLFDPFFLCY